VLVRHSVAYFLARGVPGIISFASIAIYTRLLTADEYGRYALAVAGIGLANISFQWLRLAVLRFSPAYQNRPRQLLSVILSGFLTIALLTGIIGGGAMMLWPDTEWRLLIGISILLLWARAWYELNLELTRIGLDPKRYGLLRLTKAVVGLGVGVLLILAGLGATAPLVGLIAGMTAAGIGLTGHMWKNTVCGWRLLKTDLAKKLLRYGLPLTASFALAFVVNASDRLLIGWMLGESQTGVYAAGYDLAQQTITTIMTIVNLAAYPLAVRALEKNGEEAAFRQLRKNGTLLMAVAFPSCAGLAILAPSVAQVFLGEAFQETGAILIPWISLAALLSGIRSYHFDLAFQLGNRTVKQVWVLAGAGALNLLLNVILIPYAGVIGAAYASVASFMLGIGLSVALGRSILKVPLAPQGWYKILVATAIMALVIDFIRWEQNVVLSLATQVAVGVLTYGGAVYAWNLANLRSRINNILLSR
jgi:O-antigen/teichoic acid export membrane protein